MPLTAAQRKHLERRLLDERARITQDLARFTRAEADEDEQDRAGDLSKMPFHQADQGTDTMDAELAASNATRQSAELSQIDDALERLAKSPAQFGVCETSGEDIPFERLDIIPWARTCEGR
ncbi:MAG TPA: TraR/DksA C4-type zinc finger protein [Gemmatimonadaceae bacterium]|jgi:RNA polymerase-binding transcription factor DksA